MRAVHSGHPQADGVDLGPAGGQGLAHHRVQDLLDRELALGLEVRAARPPFAEDVAVAVGQEGDRLGATGVDPQDVDHSAPKWTSSIPASRTARFASALVSTSSSRARGSA